VSRKLNFMLNFAQNISFLRNKQIIDSLSRNPSYKNSMEYSLPANTNCILIIADRDNGQIWISSKQLEKQRFISYFEGFPNCVLLKKLNYWVLPFTEKEYSEIKSYFISQGKALRIIKKKQPKNFVQFYLNIETERPVTWLFEGEKKGKPYSAESIKKVVKKAKTLAGINSPVTPHMFRHSYATHLLEDGVDIRYIQQLMGHSSTKTTEIYTYVSTRHLSKIKNPIDGLDIE